MTAPLNDVGTMYATFTDPEGTVHQLSNVDPALGHFTTFGVAGWGGRSFDYTTDVIGRGGEEIRNIRAQPIRLTWPLHIYGETHLEFVARYRTLRRAFLMTATRQLPGVLRVARPDGSAREIDVYFEDGWGGQPGENWLSANPVLTLYCPRGAWRDAVPTTITREFGAAVDFLNPFPQVSSSTVLGATTLTNPGDIEAWPDWVLSGPATEFTATNNATGKTFTITWTITAGQQILITTYRPSVRNSAGSNLVGMVNWPTAYLWPLPPGDSDVTFTVTGSSAGTAVDLSFAALYEGA